MFSISSRKEEYFCEVISWCMCMALHTTAGRLSSQLWTAIAAHMEVYENHEDLQYVPSQNSEGYLI